MGWLLELLTALADSGSSYRQSVVATPARATRPESPTLTYRSRDGRDFFRFRMGRDGEGIRVHILEFPNPERGSCHVLHDSAGPYVCWSRPIRSEAEAKAVAAMWAEATIQYQRHGRYF